MATLKDWFETKDYGIGLALLGKHCKNRAMLQALGRKSNPEKLEYELSKVALAQNIPIVPAQTIIPKEKVSAVSHSDQVIDQMNAEEKSTRKNIVRSGSVVSPDDLPPELKKLWKQNTDSYKLVRSLHEKLKLMEKSTAEDRAPLVRQIASLDESVIANWSKIDAWDPDYVEPATKIEAIDHKRINANRKFICTNLKSILTAKDEEKADEIRRKLSDRYNELRNAGEELDPETIVKLTNLGIN